MTSSISCFCFILVAPLCAFLNNIVEIRIDANKFVSDVRRPVAKQVADIGIYENIFLNQQKIHLKLIFIFLLFMLGIWRLIIAAISKLAILTNVIKQRILISILSIY